MPHQRKLIREAVKAALVAAGTAAADRVFETRLVPWRTAQLPAISVYSRSEDGITVESEPRVLRRPLSLVIEGVVIANQDVDDALDALSLEIERAMHADPTLGDVCGDSYLASVELGMMDVEGARPMGAVQLVYAVTYRTGAPEAEDVTLDPLEEARVSYTSGGNLLLMPGAAGGYVTTPDSPAVSITGDLDFRVRLAMNDWPPPAGASSLMLIGKYGAAGTWSYAFSVNSTGNLVLQLSTTGSNQFIGTSTVATGFSDGSAHWVRVTRSGAAVKFYTSEDGDTWVQLGANVTLGTAGSIFDGTAVLGVGGWTFDSREWAGRLMFAELRNGIGGTIVAQLDPNDDADPGAASIVSEQTGETWTLGAGVSLTTEAAQDIIELEGA